MSETENYPPLVYDREQQRFVDSPLVAAAPKMLEALELVIKDLNANRRGRWRHIDLGWMREWTWACVLDAITKAKGEL